MSSSNILINKLSRRVALLSIASTAGFVVVGCNTASGSAGTSTPVVASTPTATTKSIPSPTSTSTPTSTPSAQPGTTLLTYKGHTSQVVSVAWSPDSKLVASIEQEGAIHVWEAATGSPIFVGKNPSSGNTGLTWSANGKYIAGVSSAGVSVWDANNGSLITSYKAPNGIIALAFSPDSESIATSSFDKTVQIWKATTGAHMLTYNGHNTTNGLPVVSLSWSPDGKQIVSSSSMRGGSAQYSMPSVKVWDTATGKDMLVFNTTDQSNAVAWSPDGSRIASEEFSNGTETVQIWAPENGRGLALTINNDTVQKISWSPNSKYVALAIGSYQALLPSSRVEVHSAGGDTYNLVYKGHEPNVRDVSWSPDGSRIASCSDDKTVQIWQAPN